MTAQVMTFDEGGVTGHPNHVATFRGVRWAAVLSKPVSTFSIRSQEDVLAAGTTSSSAQQGSTAAPWTALWG